MLTVDDLWATIGAQEVLRGISLTIAPGQTHVLMGPNGAGKSTLAKVLAGHPDCTVVRGAIRFQQHDLLQLPPEARAQQGLFVSFQYPPEIPGVSNRQFLQAAVNKKRTLTQQPPLSEAEFATLLADKMAHLEIGPELSQRHLNAGFSGGEKKQNEILQMALLEPQLAILDETDSGLDIDALRRIAAGIKKLQRPRALLLITHYQRLLDYIPPDVVHVLRRGKIVATGGFALAKRIEAAGYDWLAQ